jgi:hypothetical protein
VLLVLVAVVAVGCGESRKERLGVLRVDPVSIERLQLQIEKLCAGTQRRTDCVIPRVIVPEDRARLHWPRPLVTREPDRPATIDRVAAFLHRLARLGHG